MFHCWFPASSLTHFQTKWWCEEFWGIFSHHKTLLGSACPQWSWRASDSLASATGAVLVFDGKGCGMEHNQGILRDAKQLVGAWKNRPTAGQCSSLMTDSSFRHCCSISYCVIYVLISLKAAHYSTHFQVDLELLLLILCVCESLEKTKSERATIHKEGWIRTSHHLVRNQYGTGLQGPVWVSCLTCCVTDTEGLGHGTRARMWACSSVITGRSSWGFALVLPFISFLLSPVLNIT